MHVATAAKREERSANTRPAPLAPRSSRPPGGTLRDLILGTLIIAAWLVLQFGTVSPTGWIHLLLIAGVGLVIRGITLSTPGNGQAE